MNQSWKPDLQALRRAKGLKQQEFAKQLDIYPSRLSRIENGELEPPFELARRMAKALDVSMEKLYLAWEEGKRRHQPREGQKEPEDDEQAAEDDAALALTR